MRADVILTTLNGASHVGYQLDALERQGGLDDVELVVSDNGSTDGTQDIVRSHEDRFPHLVLVDSSAEKGVSYARNAGAAVARGDDLLFLDDDDVVGDGWLAAMLAALADQPFVAARLEHRLLNPDSDHRPIAANRRSTDSSGPIHRGSTSPSAGPSASDGRSTRRSVTIRCGFTRSADDCDYCYRVALSGTALTFAPDAIVHYRHRQQTTAIFSQARTYGESTVRLLSIYQRQGMGRPSVPKAIASWMLMLLRLPFELPTRAGRARWIWRLGWRLGRLQGSVRWGIFSP